jgi:restriction endonuclease Mrr
MIHRFACHSSLTTPSLSFSNGDERTALVEVSGVINEKLIQYFTKYPHRLYDLHPRSFEELVAELWDAFGFAVELTKRTRDGGVDIMAVRGGPKQLKYVVECKRYSSDRPVGIEIVQRLFGVTYLMNADRGAIVNASHFSQPAQRTLSQSNWLLEGHDFHSLTSWLHDYQQFRMYKELGVTPHEEPWLRRTLTEMRNDQKPYLAGC